MAAFDEVRFPLKVQYGSDGGPQFSTDVVVLQNGFERRNQCWSQARHRYDARTGVVSANDAALLLAFFQARAGRARGFRLKDWNDFTSARDGVSAPSFQDQTIGTGDGSSVSFQLIKTYGGSGISYQRAIRKPVAGSVVIGVAGVKYETSWTVDTTTGLVTFAQAPVSGAVLTAGFQFDVPVRFDTDRISLNAQNAQLYDASIPLIEVRT